ncbi:MAG: helix-turn-helix transcriptional regulator [Pseudomonadota bacterium]
MNTAADPEDFANIVAGLYAAATGDKPWEDALAAITARYHGVGTQLFIVDETSASVPLAVIQGLNLEAAHAYNERFTPVCPRFRYVASNPSADVVYDYLHSEENERSRDEAIGFLRDETDGGFYLGSVSRPTTGAVAALAIQRSESIGHVDEREISEFRFLHSHVVRSVNIALGLQFGSIFTQTEDATRAFALADARGRLVFHGSRLEEMTARNDGMTLFGHRLVLQDAAAHNAVHRDIHAIASADRACAASPARLGRRPSGKAPWRITVSPAPTTPVPCEQAVAMILVEDRHARLEGAASIAAARFGLTEKEAIVLKHLLFLSAPSEVAAALGVSRETIRTHIKSIYRKLDVRNHPELLQRTL